MTSGCADKTAESYKDDGNGFFRAKLYARAISSYTEGLRVAPTGSHLRVALFSNRAQCLLNLQLYQHALDDADNALAIDSKHLKSRSRRGESLFNLTRYEEARQEFLKVVQLTNSSAVAEAFKLKLQKCEQLASKAKQINSTSHNSAKPPESQKNSEATEPGLQIGRSTTEVGLHRSIEFSQSDGSGRCVRVKEVKSNSTSDDTKANDLSKGGQALIVEHPFAAVLKKEFRHSRCWWCFACLTVSLRGLNSSEKPQAATYFVPCTNCAAALYCSNACRDADRFHTSEFECGDGFVTATISEEAHLACRILYRQAVLKERSRAHEDFDPLVPGSMERMQSLMTHAEEMDTGVLDLCRLTAETLAKHFQSRQRKQASTFAPSVETLLKVMLQIHVNAVAITQLVAAEEVDTGPVESVEQKRIAVALYPSVAMTNHSCIPNAFFSFSRRKISLRNSRALQPGEEVFVSYGPTTASMDSTKERRKALKDQYCFDCGCTACASRLSTMSQAAVTPERLINNSRMWRFCKVWHRNRIFRPSEGGNTKQGAPVRSANQYGSRSEARVSAGPEVFTHETNNFSRRQKGNRRSRRFPRTTLRIAGRFSKRIETHPISDHNSGALVWQVELGTVSRVREAGKIDVQRFAN